MINFTNIFALLHFLLLELRPNFKSNFSMFFRIVAPLTSLYENSTSSKTEDAPRLNLNQNEPNHEKFTSSIHKRDNSLKGNR